MKNEDKKGSHSVAQEESKLLNRNYEDFVAYMARKWPTLTPEQQHQVDLWVQREFELLDRVKKAITRRNAATMAATQLDSDVLSEEAILAVLTDCAHAWEDLEDLRSEMRKTGAEFEFIVGFRGAA